ncbi:MAG TPA: MFS transporter, partial [Candidatus Obscuribacterales bacterium]
DAVYTIYAAVVAYLLFSFLLRNFHYVRIRYALFAAIAVAGFAAVMCCLAQDRIIGLPKAVTWYVLALFGFALLRWIVSEFITRYLDPSRAQSYFSYVSAFFEGGALCVILSLKLSGHVLSANQTLFTVATCCALASGLICIQFLPAANFEALPQEAPAEPETNGSPVELKPVTRLFLFMTATFAAIEVSEDFLVKSMLRHTLGTYEAIRSMTDTYFAASCALIVLFSLVIGKAIERKRMSPIVLLCTYGGIMCGFAMVCGVVNWFYLFIAFEVTRRMCEYCLYRPANQMLLSAFSPKLRPRLIALHSFTYYVAVRLLLAMLFTPAGSLAIGTTVTFVLFMIAANSVIAISLLLRFRQAFADALYALVRSMSNADAVLAANMLSYVRPQDYVMRMQEILAGDPRKILHKTVVLGLGYCPDDSSIDVIRKELQSDKEEVQIAALHALKASGKFRAMQIMVNILRDKSSARTQRVRLSAMHLIAGIFGDKAVPFLLNGLDDFDPRVVANTLEVLSYFRQRDLKRYFFRYVDAKTPRIRANALLGLAQYPELRSQIKMTIVEALQENNVPLTASLLYVIGRIRDRGFREEVGRIYDDPQLRHHPALTNVLAWAMVMNGDPRGFHLFNEIISLPDDAATHAGFLHFFALSPQTVRYDILRQFVGNGSSNPAAAEQLCRRLDQSVYDFHDEVEYLKLCMRSFAKREASRRTA